MGNTAVIPDGWTMDVLPGPHEPELYNLKNANAFFIAGLKGTERAASQALKRLAEKGRLTGRGTSNRDPNQYYEVPSE